MINIARYLRKKICTALLKIAFLHKERENVFYGLGQKHFEKVQISNKMRYFFEINMYKKLISKAVVSLKKD